MKIELKMFSRPYEEGEELGFSFWKRDVKTEYDKIEIARLLEYFYQVHCVMCEVKTEEIEKIIKESKRAKITLIITETDNGISLLKG